MTPTELHQDKITLRQVEKYKMHPGGEDLLTRHVIVIIK